MDLLLEGKVALVTGAARGIGAATALQLAGEGARVAVLDKDREAGREMARRLGDNGFFIEADLTVDAAVAEGVARVVQRFGRLDVLVNNAGVNDRVSLAHAPESFRASLERNLVQVFACAHHARPHIVAQRGCIINVGSKVAETGQGHSSGYAASKGGVHALTREWAVDLAPHGVRVNTVVPAEVWTPLYERWLDESTPDPAAARAAIEATIPLGQRMTTCEEVAATIVFLASPRSAHTTGQRLFVDGGYTHLDRACTAKQGT